MTSKYVVQTPLEDTVPRTPNVARTDKPALWLALSIAEFLLVGILAVFPIACAATWLIESNKGASSDLNKLMKAKIWTKRLVVVFAVLGALISIYCIAIAVLFGYTVF